MSPPAFAASSALVDVPALVEDLFARAFEESGGGDRLAATGVVLAIDFADLDRTLALDLPLRRVESDLAATATARIEIGSADLNRYLQDDLNLTLAIAQGEVRVSGAIVPVLAALGPQTDLLCRLYRRVLISRGRTDLLIANR
ncbi:MAG TPA: hypothetical protein VHU88_12055 [Sporichthyaceae bacterium]|jgi:hypothetical protein|nr:hypothetical protein [Sporichthyaceae bacterium]